MLKKGLALGLILVFFSLPCFAEGESGESITITTYYPSPYGSYNELEVYRSVTYKPVDKDALSDPKEGELVYNSSDSELYLYNGSTWVAQGGGGGGAVLTLVGGLDSCTACPVALGWTQVLYGFWNCNIYTELTAQTPAKITGGSGCFCGDTSPYEMSYSGQFNYFAALRSSGQYYRCRVCVK